MPFNALHFEQWNKHTRHSSHDKTLNRWRPSNHSPKSHFYLNSFDLVYNKLILQLYFLTKGRQDSRYDPILFHFAPQDICSADSLLVNFSRLYRIFKLSCICCKLNNRVACYDYKVWSPLHEI